MNSMLINPFDAAQLLLKGSLVALPTETVYGLAGNAFNETAIKAIFELKGRPFIDPLIVHIALLDQITTLAHTNEYVNILAKAFWPGPLTLLLPKKQIVSNWITAGRSSVALRMPAHPLFIEVLKICAFPLVAPSANPFGYLSPTRPEHVRSNFSNFTLNILDGGPCNLGIESTILDLTNPSKLQILRPGPVSAEVIEAVLHQPITQVSSYLKPDLLSASLPQRAPGMLSRHYSPRTPLTLLNEPLTPLQIQNLKLKNVPIAYVSLQSTDQFQDISCIKNFWLSDFGDLTIAAQNLFHILYIVDQHIFTHIYIEALPSEGIGIALNNRLSRASVQ